MSKISLVFIKNILFLNSSKEIASFLKSNPTISKDKLGEYFGKNDPFVTKVLLEFTELVNMESLDIDQALRVYLKLFTLPGESQQVDRIAQAFAQKYYKDNYNVLNSSEAAYTLTYLLIMLQTDLHNPQVKDKMKLTDFIKTARGINDGKDLAADYLKRLYYSISETPLALHHFAKFQKDNLQTANSSIKAKHNMFAKEGENMLKEVKEIIRKGKRKNSYFMAFNLIDYYKPLLELLWSPLLATFSVVFENSQEKSIINLCLSGLYKTIKLASYFDLNDARDTMVITLVKFTNISSPK